MAILCATCIRATMMTRTTRMLAGSLAVTLLLSGFPALAEARWVRLVTPNFEFVGDASEGDIRRTAERLEQFREALVRALPDTAATSPVPTVVLVFGSQGSLAPYRPLFEGKPVEVGGYFVDGEDRNVIAVNAELGDQALGTIYHEYAHAVTSNQVGALPVWASEGLAELYETFESRNGGRAALIGRAPGRHLQLLRSATLIPLRELFAMTHSSTDYNEGNRRGVFYAQSWALVHYLNFGSPARVRQFLTFVQNLSTFPNQEEAAKASFGNWAQLEDELRNYVGMFAFPAIQLDFAEKVKAASGQRGQPMEDNEARVYLADALGRLGRPDEARTMLQPLLRDARAAGRAAAALAMLELREHRAAEAFGLLEPVASREATDLVVQSAWARVLVSRISDAEVSTDDRRALLAQAKAALGRLVEAQPNVAYPAGLLAFVELSLGADLARAEALALHAIKLAPAREDYRILHAEVLAAQGELDKATNVLGPLMARARRTETRSAARNALGGIARMRAARERAASSAAADAVAASAPAEATRMVDFVTLANLVGSSGQVLPPRPPPFIPALRQLGAGESRVLGVFRAVECGSNLFSLIVETQSGTIRLGARLFDEIEFITYRSETPGTVGCGSLASPTRALVTYRAQHALGTDAGVLGQAVAVELLPDDYTPPSGLDGK